jgi:predicted PurR-regulated permease PerM
MLKRPPAGIGGRREPPSTRYTLTVIGTVLVLAYLLRYVALPMAGAAIVAYFVQPAIDRLSRRCRAPRTLVVVVIYVVLLCCVASVIFWAATALPDRLADAAQELPKRIGTLAAKLFGPTLHLFGQTMPSSEAGHWAMDGLGSRVLRPDAILSVGPIAIAIPVGLVIGFVTLFYFMNSGRQIAEGVLWLVPPRYRAECADLARRIDPMLRRYVTGVLIIVAYTTLVAWLVLFFVFHVPLSAVIAIAVGVFEVVPVIGPILSMVLLDGIAIVQGGSVSEVLALALFAIALRLSIDQILGPLVLGHFVTLHPIVIIFAFMTGVTLFGVLGVLFAIPVAAAVKIVLTVWYAEETHAIDRAGP